MSKRQRRDLRIQQALDAKRGNRTAVESITHSPKGICVKTQMWVNGSTTFVFFFQITTMLMSAAA